MLVSRTAATCGAGASRSAASTSPYEPNEATAVTTAEGRSCARRAGTPRRAAIVAAVGLLLVIVRWLSFPQYHAGGGLSYDVGARYGIFLALIAGIAEVTAAVMSRRSAGDQATPEPAPPEPGPDAPAAPEE